MTTHKIFLLIFILSINVSAQEDVHIFEPVGANKVVQIAETFETIIEVKCFEVESDTGKYLILLNRIRNFSEANFFWKINEAEIYSREIQFKPVGYQTIINIDHSLPEILDLQVVENIEVKRKSTLSILILFSKWKNSDKYETLVDKMDADLIVGTAGLITKQNSEWIFRMIYFQKAD